VRGSSETYGNRGDAVAAIPEAGLTPDEMLEHIEMASAAASALWSYVMLVPASRPELRVLLCHLWDGCTSDTNLALRMRVHRHTVRRWRKELQGYLVRR